MITTTEHLTDRADQAELLAAREAFLADTSAMTLMDAVPDYAVVLNRHRQIIAANQAFLRALGFDDIEALMGLRLGESVSCTHAHDTPGGCGTCKYCIYCGGMDAMMESLRTHQSVTRECRITSRGEADGGALDLEVQATFVQARGHDLLFLVMRNIGSENRRRALEHVFFHDVLNTATGIKMISDLLADAEDMKTVSSLGETLTRLSKRLVDEITSQQLLLAAEQGDLRLELHEINVAEHLHDLLHSYRQLTPHCTLELSEAPDYRIVTDGVILQRILGNLLKNALEATAAGGKIVIAARRQQDSVIFSVHNPGVMPEAVQRQIFQRSFSTKGQRGRGLGTYSVKLFTERYLCGNVSFTSREPEGTVFSVTLPMHCNTRLL